VDTPEERAFFIRLREAGIYCGRWSDAKKERVAGPDGPRVFVSGLQDLEDLYGAPCRRLGLTGPAPSDVLVVATFILSKNGSFSLALDGSNMIKTGQDIKFPPKRRRALLHSGPHGGICAASIAGFVGESVARAQCREAAKRLEALLLEAGLGGVSLEHVAAASGDLRVVGRGAHDPGLLSALREEDLRDICGALASENLAAMAAALRQRVPPPRGPGSAAENKMLLLREVDLF
jgi:hypothetical protein